MRDAAVGIPGRQPLVAIVEAGNAVQRHLGSLLVRLSAAWGESLLSTAHTPPRLSSLSLTTSPS